MDHISEKITVTKRIIEMLIENIGDDGITRITQQEIAKKVGKSPSSK